MSLVTWPKKHRLPPPIATCPDEQRLSFHKEPDDAPTVGNGDTRASVHLGSNGYEALGEGLQGHLGILRRGSVREPLLGDDRRRLVQRLRDGAHATWR